MEQIVEYFDSEERRTDQFLKSVNLERGDLSGATDFSVNFGTFFGFKNNFFASFCTFSVEKTGKKNN